MNLEEIIKLNKKRVTKRVRDQYGDTIYMNRDIEYDLFQFSRAEGDTMYVDAENLYECVEKVVDKKLNYSDDDMFEWLRKNSPDNEFDEFGNVVSIMTATDENKSDIAEKISARGDLSKFSFVVAYKMTVMFDDTLDIMGDLLGFAHTYHVSNGKSRYEIDFIRRHDANCRHKEMYRRISDALDVVRQHIPKTMTDVIDDFFSKTGRYYKTWQGKKLKKVMELLTDHFFDTVDELADDITINKTDFANFIADAGMKFDKNCYYVDIYPEDTDDIDEIATRTAEMIDAINEKLKECALTKNMRVEEYEYDFIGNADIKYIYRLGSVFNNGVINVSLNYEELSDDYSMCSDLHDGSDEYDDEYDDELHDYIITDEWWERHEKRLENIVYSGICEYLRTAYVHDAAFKSIVDSKIENGNRLESIDIMSHDNMDIINSVIRIDELAKYADGNYVNPNKIDYLEECKKRFPKALKSVVLEIKKHPLYRDLNVDMNENFEDNGAHSSFMLKHDKTDPENNVLFDVNYINLANNARESNWTMSMLDKMMKSQIYNVLFAHIILYVSNFWEIRDKSSLYSKIKDDTEIVKMIIENPGTFVHYYESLKTSSTPDREKINRVENILLEVKKQTHAYRIQDSKMQNVKWMHLSKNLR